MAVNDVINVIGRGTSVDFTIDDSAPFDLVTQVLDEYLKENSTLYSKGNITVNVGRRMLCPDQMAEIKRILDQGSGFNVSRFWCAPDVLEEVLTNNSEPDSSLDISADLSRQLIESEIAVNSKRSEHWDSPESAKYAEMAYKAKVQAEEAAKHSPVPVSKPPPEALDEATADSVEPDHTDQELAYEKADLARNPEPGRGVQALLVKNTCRSGEVIRYPGDVIVLADVNPGAKIIAAGDIIVLGSLRGLAHAGAPADRRAKIVALKLDAHRLQIGSYVGLAPKSNSRSRSSRTEPQIAYVRRRSIYVERYAGRLEGYNGGVLYDG